MNTSQQAFGASGMPDAMPAGSMASSASGEMPSGAMDAASGGLGMPSGAMFTASPPDLSGPQAQAGGSMPGGSMLEAASAGMPMGAMNTESGGSDAWNMDLASPQQQPCGC
jgi:hypothetical protein